MRFGPLLKKAATKRHKEKLKSLADTKPPEENTENTPPETPKGYDLRSSLSRKGGGINRLCQMSATIQRHKRLFVYRITSGFLHTLLLILIQEILLSLMEQIGLFSIKKIR
jgi:hypothetical protein